MDPGFLMHCLLNSRAYSDDSSEGLDSDDSDDLMMESVDCVQYANDKSQVATGLRRIISSLPLPKTATIIFCTHGKVQLQSIPTIHIEGLGRLSLPVKEKKLKKLKLFQNEKGENIQIESPKITLGTALQNYLNTQILPSIRREFNIPQNNRISLNLVKLLAIGEGEIFNEQLETNGKAFGTLLVQIPTAHKGGAITIEHQKYSITFDPKDGAVGENNFYYTAFYSSCTYKAAPIEAGYKAYLLFNMVDNSTILKEFNKCHLDIEGIQLCEQLAAQMRGSFRVCPFNSLYENVNENKLDVFDNSIYHYFSTVKDKHGDPIFELGLGFAERKVSGFSRTYREYWDDSDSDEDSMTVEYNFTFQKVVSQPDLLDSAFSPSLSTKNFFNVADIESLFRNKNPNGFPKLAGFKTALLFIWPREFSVDMFALDFNNTQLALKALSRMVEEAPNSKQVSSTIERLVDSMAQALLEFFHLHDNKELFLTTLSHIKQMSKLNNVLFVSGIVNTKWIAWDVMKPHILAIKTVDDSLLELISSINDKAIQLEIFNSCKPRFDCVQFSKWKDLCLIFDRNDLITHAIEKCSSDYRMDNVAEILITLSKPKFFGEFLEPSLNIMNTIVLDAEQQQKELETTLKNEKDPAKQKEASNKLQQAREMLKFTVENRENFLTKWKTKIPKQVGEILVKDEKLLDAFPHTAISKLLGMAENAEALTILAGKLLSTKQSVVGIWDVLEKDKSFANLVPFLTKEFANISNSETYSPELLLKLNKLLKQDATATGKLLALQIRSPWTPSLGAQGIEKIIMAVIDSGDESLITQLARKLAKLAGKTNTSFYSTNMSEIHYKALHEFAMRSMKELLSLGREYESFVGSLITALSNKKKKGKKMKLESLLRYLPLVKDNNQVAASLQLELVDMILEHCIQQDYFHASSAVETLLRVMELDIPQMNSCANFKLVVEKLIVCSSPQYKTNYTREYDPLMFIKNIPKNRISLPLVSSILDAFPKINSHNCQMLSTESVTNLLDFISPFISDLEEQSVINFALGCTNFPVACFLHLFQKLEEAADGKKDDAKFMFFFLEVAKQAFHYIEKTETILETHPKLIQFLLMSDKQTSKQICDKFLNLPDARKKHLFINLYLMSEKVQEALGSGFSHLRELYRWAIQFLARNPIKTWKYSVNANMDPLVKTFLESELPSDSLFTGTFTSIVQARKKAELIGKTMPANTVTMAATGSGMNARIVFTKPSDRVDTEKTNKIVQTCYSLLNKYPASPPRQSATPHSPPPPSGTSPPAKKHKPNDDSPINLV